MNYKNRYNTKTKILSDIKGFVSETYRILEILEDRIKKEDANLYPIFYIHNGMNVDKLVEALNQER